MRPSCKRMPTKLCMMVEAESDQLCVPAFTIPVFVMGRGQPKNHLADFNQLFFNQFLFQPNEPHFNPFRTQLGNSGTFRWRFCFACRIHSTSTIRDAVLSKCVCVCVYMYTIYTYSCCCCCCCCCCFCCRCRCRCCCCCGGGGDRFLVSSCFSPFSWSSPCYWWLVVVGRGFRPLLAPVLCVPDLV